MTSSIMSTTADRFLEDDVTLTDKVLFERALDFHNIVSTSTVAFVCTGCGSVGVSPTEEARNFATKHFDFSSCDCDGGRRLTLTSDHVRHN